MIALGNINLPGPKYLHSISEYLKNKLGYTLSGKQVGRLRFSQTLVCQCVTDSTGIGQSVKPVRLDL